MQEFARRTVLLVDDNPDLLGPMSDFLERSGFHVLPARSAEEAFGIMDSDAEHVDALVSDVVMPGISGVELAETMRRQHPRLGVVLMSGHCDPMRDADHQGFAFLQKPFSWKSLVKTIDSVVVH